MYHLYESLNCNDWKIGDYDTIEDAKAEIDMAYEQYQRMISWHDTDMIDMGNYVDYWVIYDEEGNEVYHEDAY